VGGGPLQERHPHHASQPTHPQTDGRGFLERVARAASPLLLTGSDARRCYVFALRLSTVVNNEKVNISLKLDMLSLCFCFALRINGTNHAWNIML